MITTYAASRVARSSQRRGPTARTFAVTGRNLIAIRHSAYWLVVISGLFEPVLYLFSIGIGVGGLISGFTLPDGTVLSYREFVAPGMLAVSAMQGAISEVSFNFFARLRWAKLYDAMVATPLQPFEVAVGELSWAMIRGSVYSAAFLAIMVGLGLTTVGWAVPALAAAILTGFAFGGAGMAVTTLMRNWQDFDYVNTATFAMFLFAGTFAPVDAFPPGIRVLIQWTPLTQAVDLIRGLTIGRPSWSMLVNVVYLGAMAAAGLLFASRRMRTLLCP
jgi:lipooligosaccharide transport system permease protein